MRVRTKLTVAILVVAAVTAGSLFGGTLLERGSSGSAPAAAPNASAVAADQVLTGLVGSGRTDTRALERAVQDDPTDGRSLVLLGFAHLQRWREAADASALPRSEAALRRALRVDPNDPLAVVGLGSLALSRHDFRKALSLGRHALLLEPSSARAYGVVGDALLELGRYEQAFAAFDRMVALKPSVASYARIAYARELLGDLRGAEAAMQLAADSATGQAEPSAWVRVELAVLALGRGDVQRAERHLRTALTILPGYVYAYGELAHVEAGRGNLRAAIRAARIAADAVPLPGSVELLAELHQRAGNAAAARQQFARVDALSERLAANGMRTEVGSIVSEADRRIGMATLVERARAARAAQPSIVGDDALAWALARTGRCDEARTWSQRSLRLGTRNALVYFHRAEIERCAGNPSAARSWARRALALDPTFSVRWAPVARRLATAGPDA